MPDLAAMCEHEGQRVADLGGSLASAVRTLEAKHASADLAAAPLTDTIVDVFSTWSRVCNCRIDDNRTRLLLMMAGQADSARDLLLAVCLATSLPIFGEGLSLAETMLSRLTSIGTPAQVTRMFKTLGLGDYRSIESDFLNVFEEQVAATQFIGMAVLLDDDHSLFPAA